ncbi:MAG: hypothetical protein HY698_17760 [Deltaproteobacteria bacterium]|nr:hypothetical protein [Deltaproteobacteria bacterium]
MPMPSERSPTEASIIAHNIKEHVEMLLELEKVAVRDDVKERLHRHIAEEERGNAERMNQILESHPPPIPRDLLLVRDHSLMILDILTGALPPAIGQKLLHHLLEEHNEIISLGREEAARTPPERTAAMEARPVLRLTLGSLRTSSE